MIYLTCPSLNSKGGSAKFAQPIAHPHSYLTVLVLKRNLKSEVKFDHCPMSSSNSVNFRPCSFELDYTLVFWHPLKLTKDCLITSKPNSAVHLPILLIFCSLVQYETWRRWRILKLYFLLYTRWPRFRMF